DSAGSELLRRCGNGVCGAWESCSSCPADCGQCPGSQTTAPVLSVSPATVSPGGQVTLTWSGVSISTATDWIGRYAPGDPDGSFQDWIYVSCSQTAGTANASGSCSYTMPAASGTYEFRLFAADGSMRLATSQQVTVSGGDGGSAGYCGDA